MMKTQFMDDSTPAFIPENVTYLCEQMSQYSRNRFRLETVSADTASAGRIITVNLPEGSTLDMKSFRMHYTALTNQNTVGTATCFAKLPQDAAQSLIQRVEVSLNGISLQQGASEYNTIYQVKKMGAGNLGRTQTVDRSVSHAEIDTTDAVDEESLVCQDWVGFLNELSTRFVSTELFGGLQVRITMAPNSVLVPKIAGVAMQLPLGSVDAAAAAGNMSYTVSDIFFTIDSVSLGPVYTQALQAQLATDGYLPVNFKEYYSFNLDSIASGASTPRFSLSSASMDRLYGLYRDSNFQTVGVRGHQLTDAVAGSPSFVSNALRFRAYNSSDTLAGTLRYNWSVNNVQIPQFRADILSALCDVSYAQDKVGLDAEGTNVSSKRSFNNGKYVNSQMLSHPTKFGVSVKSGLDSRGISTMMTWQNTGMVIPPASPISGATPAGTGETGILSSFVVVECTSELRVSMGKSVAVIL